MAALRTPLYDWHVAHGGRMVEFGGWGLPVQFAGVIAEHQAVRSSAGLFDISHMGRLSFAGPGGEDLIQHAWTNDAATMTDGQARYGLICNENGGVRDDVLVYRWPYGWAMVVNASNRMKIVEHLEAEKGDRDVKVIDQTTTTAMLAVQGPKAVGLCRDLFEADPESLQYYHAAPTRCRGLQCVVSRTGYTGEDGIEIMIGAAYATDLADEIVSRGAVPCGLGARDTLRLEAAMPLYGHELTEDIDPLHARLGWAVKLQKGDFIGRSSLLMQREQVGRSGRQRVGMVLEGKRAAREGCPIVLGDGRAVGVVTSGSFTPTLQKSIAMAYVEPTHAAIGTRLNADVRGKIEPAQIVALPFYKRAK
ncbi:MAG TPA: glycine cleavage system aminomethyltransferase GcvT [Gemmataceae bacterium]|jgi:aminomethyltransferase|nr:glycine cleavage system aminomethyltransferase GcvT [Gemmataceae bacterium]